MIPRIIHQTWKTEDIPEKFRAYAATWRNLNTGWTYRLWTDRALLEFVASQYPAFLELYCGYRQNIQRADAARYMLLHHFGGIYADLDAECVRPIESFALEDRLVLCEEPKTHWTWAAKYRGLPVMLFNGVMASPANHAFWPHLLSRMTDVRHASDVLDSTGPCLLTGAVLSYPNQETVRIEGANFFNPIDARGNSTYDIKQIECYSIHHWAGTWWDRSEAGWLEKKRRSLAKRFYRTKARLLGGRRLDPEATRTAVSKVSISAPLPAGENIAILVPVRDAAQHIPGFLTAIDSLSLPKERLKLVFCEGDSRDGSYEKLTQLATPLKRTFRDILILRHETGTQMDRSQRWRPSLQRIRRSAIAKVRNHLIDHGLSETDDWALWLDIDVWSFPANIIQQLLAAKARIVTPNCVLTSGGPSYDLNSYISKTTRKDHRYYRLIKDGLFQPPADYPHRLKLSDLRHSDQVPLDSVGGTMLLVDAALHRGGLRFPELPYDDLIETEAFGRLAKDCGITPVGLPRVEILHVPW